jgi:hypothetical protein
MRTRTLWKIRADAEVEPYTYKRVSADELRHLLDIAEEADSLFDLSVTGDVMGCTQSFANVIRAARTAGLFGEVGK